MRNLGYVDVPIPYSNQNRLPTGKFSHVIIKFSAGFQILKY
jgi:hypothetical protein